MDGVNVLFVDDEEDFLETLLKRIKKRGVNATGVKSGEAALERLEQDLADVVILDVRMPGMWWATAIHERPAEEGVLWVGTYDGLLRFDTDTGEFERFRLVGGAAIGQGDSAYIGGRQAYLRAKYEGSGRAQILMKGLSRRRTSSDVQAARARAIQRETEKNGRL